MQASLCSAAWNDLDALRWQGLLLLGADDQDPSAERLQIEFGAVVELLCKPTEVIYSSLESLEMLSMYA